MASIGTVTLNIVRDVANAEITVTYSLTGSDSDIASHLPYSEVCRLVGVDGAIANPIPGGLLTPLVLPFNVVFPDTTPINRVHTKTIPLADLDEDVGPDEIRAVVTLTPLVPSTVTRESNQVTDSF
jgi:hypothetical protein